jgi:hypothetical protein
MLRLVVGLLNNELYVVTYFVSGVRVSEGTRGKLLVTHTLDFTLWLCGYWFSIV